MTFSLNPIRRGKMDTDKTTAEVKAGTPEEKTPFSWGKFFGKVGEIAACVLVGGVVGWIACDKGK